MSVLSWWRSPSFRPAGPSLDSRNELIPALVATTSDESSNVEAEAAVRRFLSSCGAVAQADAAVLASAEYRRANGGGDPRAFVEAVCRDLLGRVPGPGEAALIAGLEAGVLSPADVTAAVVSGPEYQAVLALGYFRARHGLTPTRGALAEAVALLRERIECLVPTGHFADLTHLSNAG